MAVAAAAMEAAVETEEAEAAMAEADKAVVVHHQAEDLQPWIQSSAGA